MESKLQITDVILPNHDVCQQSDKQIAQTIDDE